MPTTAKAKKRPTGRVLEKTGKEKLRKEKGWRLFIDFPPVRPYIPCLPFAD